MQCDVWFLAVIGRATSHAFVVRNPVFCMSIANKGL